jgi:hypothetical protein
VEIRSVDIGCDIEITSFDFSAPSTSSPISTINGIIPPNSEEMGHPPVETRKRKGSGRKGRAKSSSSVSGSGGGGGGGGGGIWDGDQMDVLPDTNPNSNPNNANGAEPDHKAQAVKNANYTPSGSNKRLGDRPVGERTVGEGDVMEDIS